MFFLLWYLLVDLLEVWRFGGLPKLVESIEEWLSPDPIFGVSIYTAEYYVHIWASIVRVASAFLSATVFGIAIGILMGWRRIFFGLTFPILELLRPIPILAWIPLAIILLPGRELPIIGLTFLAAFFVTILNTLLGVRAIDRAYFRAAECLGFSQWQILWHVIVPGAHCRTYSSACRSRSARAGFPWSRPKSFREARVSATRYGRRTTTCSFPR